MEKFDELTSQAIPFLRANVDTDIIIPARYLKTVSREGLGEGAFYALRHHKDGSIDPDCVFNDLKYKNAQILIAGENFGCGSSREHAAWALLDMGIKAVIAPSFADIFASNAFKNGILTIALEKEELNAVVEEANLGTISIDLTNQEIRVNRNNVVRFQLDQFKKYCLLNGLDEVGLTLKEASKIDKYEEKQRLKQPWLYFNR